MQGRLSPQLSPDLPVHAREIQIEVVGSPMLSSGGSLELPRPGRDPRPTHSEDGLMGFDLTLASFSRCRSSGSDAGPVIEVSIGECTQGECTQGDCTQGDCPPMRYEAVEGAELV